MAFWLFMVAIRGLDSTCTEPCDSRKEIMAAKLAVWKARPNMEPAEVAAELRPKPLLAVKPLPLAIFGGWPPLNGKGARLAPGWMKPVEMRLVWPLLIDANEAQLMPVWVLSLSSTSRIFASRITWRSTDNWVAFRYKSTLRSSSGMARITITPDCGLSTTWRPPSVLPTIASSEAFSSGQKSAVEVVVKLLLSCPGPWPGTPLCWFCPLVGNGFWPLPLLPELVGPTEATEVDDTRRLELPLRAPVR